MIALHKKLASSCVLSVLRYAMEVAAVAEVVVAAVMVVSAVVVLLVVKEFHGLENRLFLQFPEKA